MVRILKGVCWREFTGYDVVRIVIGLILLIAAGLKTHQLFSEPVLETSLLDSRWFLIYIVAFELLFGIWLLSGLASRKSWLLAVMCFSCFFFVSLYKVSSGQASCGCFGAVPIPPWATACFDVATVVALLWLAPVRGQFGDLGSNRVFQARAQLGVGISTILLAFLAFVSLATRREPAIVDLSQLSRGEWTVVLVRRGCPACHKTLQQLPEASGSIASEHIALIEVLPSNEAGAAKASKPYPGWLHEALVDDDRWFIPTPSVFRLREGFVLSRSHMLY
jgi:hypothetical protein